MTRSRVVRSEVPSRMPTPMNRSHPTPTLGSHRPPSKARTLAQSSSSCGAEAYKAGTSAGRLTIRALGILCVVLTAMTVAGCGEEELGESSTCREFLAAEPADQQSITVQLAGKFGKPDYATPLGIPAVPYYCARNPDTTLQEFFEVAG